MKSIGAIKFQNIFSHLMNNKNKLTANQNPPKHKAAINKPVAHTYDKQTVIIRW